MSNTILDNGIFSELSYTDLDKNLTANQYVARLMGEKDPVTNENHGDGIDGMTIEQAEAFAEINGDRNKWGQATFSLHVKDLLEINGDRLLFLYM